MRMGFFGLIPFNPPYLPWVMLIFSFIIGNPLETDLLGIVIGHMFYFLDHVYPKVAAVRGWSFKRLVRTPRVLHALCGTLPAGPEGVVIIDQQQVRIL